MGKDEVAVIKFGKTWIRSWSDMVRNTGQSFLDLLRAELDQVVRELGVSAKRLGIGAALLIAAGMILFWWIAVLAFFLIEIMAIWVPTWASAGIVLLILLLFIATLAFLGIRRLKSLDNPVDTVGRRWDDHLDWWENRLLPEEEATVVAHDPARSSASRKEPV